MSFERSRRELSIDLSAHRSVLKNTKIRFSHPVLVSCPKQGIALPKTGAIFYCVPWVHTKVYGFFHSIF